MAIGQVWDLWDLEMRNVLYTGTEADIGEYVGMKRPRMSEYYKHNWQLNRKFLVRPHKDRKVKDELQQKEDELVKKALWHLKVNGNYYVIKEDKEVLLKRIKKMGIKTHTTPAVFDKGDCVLWMD